MQFYKCALLCAILALSIFEPITARKSYGRGGSYPKSGGLSGGGGGSHGYPSSGGLSGSGGRGYPSSGGSHGYPSSGGSHGYPSSGGSHGYPSSGGSHGYPSSGGLSGNSAGRGNTYPNSGGGSHGYPGSSGLSGNNYKPTNHYHYTPPQSITYTPTRGGQPISYPVYRGQPPTYVYQYKDSGSKYGTLLAGLALLNLGTIAAGTAYAVSHSNSHSGGSSSYKTQPGEVCKFGLKKDNGDYEETRIDCQLISSFILAEQANQNHTQAAQQNTTTITTTTTVTNVTMFNNTVPGNNSIVNETTKVLYEMLPNGTLVPVNVPVNITNDVPANVNNPVTSSVINETKTTTTVTNALDVKGKPVDVTPNMQCFVIRTTPTSNMRKTVPCQVLQTYAVKSLKPNSANRSLPTFLILTTMMAAYVLN